MGKNEISIPSLLKFLQTSKCKTDIVGQHHRMMSADDVRRQNNIKMTIDIVGQHHQLTMTGHVVQLLHPCFSH